MKYLIKITVLLLFICATPLTVGAQDSIPRIAGKPGRYSLSPPKASMFASVMPGLGQIYNHKYWKVPIVYAGFGALGYAVAFNTSHYNDYMSAYKDFTDNLPGTDSYTKIVSIDPSEYDPVLHPDTYSTSTASWVKEQLMNGVDYYRKYRDLSYIGIAAWYLVTILDANVDASLFDYDISEDIRASVAPMTLTSTGLKPGISFTLTKNF